jgi:uncharacterized membrane protein YeaQ/YmgE (transglycosylase-associated protein family)
MIYIHNPLSLILDPGGLIAWLIVGLIAGAVASSLVRGRGYGCLGNIVVGLIGAVIGGFIASFFTTGSFHIIGTIIVSIIGAVLFLTVIRIFSGD